MLKRPALVVVQISGNNDTTADRGAGGRRLVGMGSVAVADATDQQSRRVRSNNAILTALIARATEQSSTFRGLIHAINTSDGIVYVERGVCRYSRACLVQVTTAGAYRILWVSVVIRHTDLDLMAFIGHELQHAIQILSDPHVRKTEDMYLFYSRLGTRGGGLADFETTAATKTGAAVREEIRTFMSRSPISTRETARCH